MQRLRDQLSASEPVVRRAARLCASEPPVEHDVPMEERVLRSLSRSRRRATPWILRPAVAAMALLLFVGLVRAMWHPVRAWIAGDASPGVSTPVAPAPLPAAAPVPAPIAPAPLVTPAPVELAPSRPPSVAERRSQSTRPLERARETTPAPAAPAPATPEPFKEDYLVHAALRALRNEHAPERAEVLLEDYLEKFPHGALVEEAMALAVEAALAQHAANAPALGARYLERFPHGRFVDVAERARAKNRPAP